MFGAFGAKKQDFLELSHFVATATMILVIIFYPLWGFMVPKFMLPHAYDGIWIRGVACIPALIIILIRPTRFFNKFSYDLITIALLPIMLHYLWLNHINQFHMIFVAGTFVCLASLSQSFTTLRQTIPFYSFTLFFSIYSILTVDAPKEVKVFFFAGIITIGTINFVIIYMNSTLANTIIQKNAELDRMAKISMINTMASGMAHEINNPLAIMVAGANKLKKRDMKTDEICQKYIISNAHRISKIIAEIKSLSKMSSIDIQEESGTFSLQTVAPEDLVEQVKEKVESKYGGRVKISEYENSKNLISVNIDIIVHATMNILSNAIWATEKIDHPSVALSFKEKGPEFAIDIVDNGIGISKNIEDKIFDPFFTTKSPNQGLGLGLTYVKNAVEIHRGQVRLNSNNGKTVCTMILPTNKTQHHNNIKDLNNH